MLMRNSSRGAKEKQIEWGEKGGESSNNKRVKHEDKNFPPDMREGEITTCHGVETDALCARARTLPDIGGSESFPPSKPKFSRGSFEKRSLCDALLNIRLTPQRRLRILIDKLYLSTNRASYSKLRSP